MKKIEKASSIAKNYVKEDFQKEDWKIKKQLDCFCKGIESFNGSYSTSTAVWIPQDIWDAPYVNEEAVSENGKPILFPEVIRYLKRNGYAVRFIKGFSDIQDGNKTAHFRLEVKESVLLFQYILEWIKRKFN